MKIAIIPTTGGEDPFRGMDIAVELGVEGVHIPAFGGKLDLAGKSHEERMKIRDLEVSALIGWGGDVDLGEEKRQVVAGIAKKYNAEELINRQVIILANLQPRKLMGVESQGMLLAAIDADGDPVILVPDKEVLPGAQVR